MKLMIAPAIFPPPPKKKLIMLLMGCAAGTWKKVKDTNLLTDRTFKLRTLPMLNFFNQKKYVLQTSRACQNFLDLCTII